jgi:putative ABC transport system permease protein
MTLTYLNVLLGLLLLVVPGYLFYAYDRLNGGKAALAVVRMIVQMAVMGGCLWALYRFDFVVLNLLWLLLLVVAAAFMLVSRTKIRSRVLFLPACVGMFVSVLIVTLYLLFVVLRPEHAMSARWFVPVTGVLMAHVLTTNISAVKTYFDSLRQDSQPYYTLLGNGAKRLQALAPYVTRALRSLMMPAIANLSAMGLFVLPMLLSGLLLGGMDAVTAVALFVVMMVACMTASVASVALMLWMADRYAFNRQGQLTDVFTAD